MSSDGAGAHVGCLLNTQNYPCGASGFSGHARGDDKGVLVVCAGKANVEGPSHRMSNCVGGSDGSRLPCSTIAKHSVEGCDHFSHDGHDDDLGFFVGGDEAIVEGFEGGTVTACTEGSHVQDVTD